MPAKLTPQEQQRVKQLTKLFSKALPTPSRSAAGGFAAGIVRMRQEGMSHADLVALLARYEAPEDCLDTLAETGALLKNADGTWSVPEQIPIPEKRPGKAAAAEGLATVPTETKAIEAAPATTRAVQKLSHLRQVHVVRTHTPEATDTRTKIVNLDPRLWFNGWLPSSPDAYTLFEPELIAMSQALEGSSTIGDGTLTLRELSYELFGDEKFLSFGPKGAKLLRSLGVDGLLSYKQLPKLELLQHIPRRRQNMTIVVSENLDPWVNMRELMYNDGKSVILGERVHGVVFGAGTVIEDATKLPDLVASLGAKHVSVRYWGDIDRAGLRTLSRLMGMAEGQELYDVEPFWPAYRLMLAKARKRCPSPEENEPTDQSQMAIEGLSVFERGLRPKERDYLRAVLDSACLIPQEIVTIKDL